MTTPAASVPAAEPVCRNCGETWVGLAADDDVCTDCAADAAEMAADRILERQELSDLDDGCDDAGDWS